MNGREDKKCNDLFYTCSLIEYVARKTKNSPSVIVQHLGGQRIEKIYDLADVYHSDNIDSVSDELIEKCRITEGSFDNVAECEYAVPSYWDIGKVYKRLILMVSAVSGKHIMDTLMEVFASRIVVLIEDYNSSFYYDSPNAIFETYQHNCVPE